MGRTTGAREMKDLIKPIDLNDYENVDHGIEKPIRELEQQNADLLEALRKITKRCEADMFDEWSLKAIVDIGRESIEKTTGKKWDEIKEKDNE